MSVVRVFGPDFNLIEWSFWLIWFVILSGIFAMTQAPGFNSLLFDPFSFQLLLASAIGADGGQLIKCTVDQLRPPPKADII